MTDRFVGAEIGSLTRDVAMAWLLRERASGREWRLGDSDLAWEAGGYDTARFELHVLDEDVSGAPDGSPLASACKS